MNNVEQELNEVKAEVEEINSWYMQILSDYKKQTKRQFIVNLILIIGWFLTGCYLVWFIIDTGTIEETNTQEISDINTIENSNISNGDIYGENKTN